MKTFIASIAIVGVVGLAVFVGVGAVDSADVAATVTVQKISVAVTDGVVGYGILAAGGSQNTTTASGTDDTQTATNDGNITEDLNIRGTISSPGGWTLAGTAAGATEYKHEYSTNTFATSTALTTSNQTFASGVASSSIQTFDLKITTPPGATDFTEQTVDVTVQATAS